MQIGHHDLPKCVIWTGVLKHSWIKKKKKLSGDFMSRWKIWVNEVCFYAL